MKVKFPIITKEYNEEQNKIEVEESTIECNIDTSIYAEARWEQNFPELAKREKLFDYVERINNAKGSVDGRVYITALLKPVYCFIESSDLPTYKDFLQLFDLADQDYCLKLINKLKNILDLAINSSVTKN